MDGEQTSTHQECCLAHKLIISSDYIWGVIDIDGDAVPVVNVEVSSDSHPLWTGKARVHDSEGRVAQFNRRYGRGRTA